MAMQSNNQEVQKKLAGAWRREQRFHHARGICHILLWLVGLVLVDLMLDWSLDLPGWGRVALLAVNLGLLAAVGWRRWWQRLRRFDSLRVSLAVERLHPELDSLLVSCVQLHARGDESSLASPQLIDAMKSQAVEAVRPLDFRRIVDFRKLRTIAFAATAALLAFELSSLYVGDFYRVLAIRLFNPASELSYPTRTHINTITGDLTVQQGRPVELAIDVGTDSEVPGAAILQVSHDGGPWERIRIEGDEQARFAHTMPRCNDSFVYRFRSGDAVSRRYAVNVIPSPQIVESTVKVTFPEYTKIPGEELTALNFEVIEGARMQWKVQCDRPLAAASMFCDTGESIEMEIDKVDPRISRASTKADKPLTYQFGWTDREHGYQYKDGARYSLHVTRDEAPRVCILSPFPEQHATLRKKLQIHFTAEDTFGLGDASIVYSVNGGVEHEHAMGSFVGKTQTSGNMGWKPSQWIDELAENDILTYAIQVTDNRAGEGGPNVGRSKSLTLRILGRDDYIQAMLEQRNNLFKRVKGVQKDESESAGTLKELRTEVHP